jgi:hypothetical protein
MDVETSRTQNRAHNITIYMLHPHHQFKQKPSAITEINPSVNHSTGEESSTASSEQKRSLTPLQYVVGQRASHDLRWRLLQPDKTRTKPSDIKKSTQHHTPIGNQCRRSQSTSTQPNRTGCLTLQSAWYSFCSRFRQPFSAMAKP